MGLGLRRGTVVRNNDPEHMGRVTVEVPGMIDESAWALPMGLPGAGNGGQGLWDIPKVGAQVWVLFEGDDIDSPVWAAGPFTRTTSANIPTDPKAAVEENPGDADRVRALETDFFTITWDERTDPDHPYDSKYSKQYIQLRHKASGDLVEIDGIKRGIYVKGTTAVVIESQGVLALKGLLVSINDRLVEPGNHNI